MKAHATPEPRSGGQPLRSSFLPPVRSFESQGTLARPELRERAAGLVRLGHEFARVGIFPPVDEPARAAGSAGGVIQRVTGDQRRRYQELTAQGRPSQPHAYMHWRKSVEALHAELASDSSEEAGQIRATLGGLIGGSSSSPSPVTKPGPSGRTVVPGSSLPSSSQPSGISGPSLTPSLSARPQQAPPKPDIGRSPVPSPVLTPSAQSSGPPRAVRVPVDEPRTQRITGTGDPSLTAWEGEHSWNSRFNLKIDPSEKRVKATIRLNTAASGRAFSSWKQTTSDKWSNRFAVMVPGGDGSRSEQYPIDVRLKRSTPRKPAHYTVTARGSGEPGFAATKGLKGTRSMTEWGTEDVVDVPHEVGHMLGNLDEYHTVNDIEYTPPGEAPRKGVDIGEGSIMNDPKNNPQARHYDLIRQKVGEALGKEVTVEPVEQSIGSRMLLPGPRPGSGMMPGIGIGDVGAAKSQLRRVVRPESRMQEPSSSSSELVDFRSVLRPRQGPPRSGSPVLEPGGEEPAEKPRIRLARRPSPVRERGSSSASAAESPPLTLRRRPAPGLQEGSSSASKGEEPPRLTLVRRPSPVRERGSSSGSAVETPPPVLKPRSILGPRLTPGSGKLAPSLPVPSQEAEPPPEMSSVSSLKARFEGSPGGVSGAARTAPAEELPGPKRKGKEPMGEGAPEKPRPSPESRPASQMASREAIKGMMGGYETIKAHLLRQETTEMRQELGRELQAIRAQAKRLHEEEGGISVDSLAQFKQQLLALWARVKAEYPEK